jgi:signal transduction histidine kinase/DNA-binding response OmpR family regulator
MLRSTAARLRGIRLAYVQVGFVVIAFAVMVLVSYFYGNYRERHHLQQYAYDTLSGAETYIDAYLQEKKTTLSGVSETIRIIITQGRPISYVEAFMGGISEHLLSNEDILQSVIAVYGVFDCFDFEGQIVTGVGWDAPEGYDPVGRPWYEAAVMADGAVGMTEPYPDAVSEELIITFARQIFDDNGVSLGIVCLDVTFDHLAEYAVNTRLADGGYGLMSNKDLYLIAHPRPGYLGFSVYELNDGDVIAAEMKAGIKFSSYDARDPDNNRHELFWMRFDNGWVLGVMTPYDTYYKSIHITAWFLSILGAVMAIGLSVVLLSVTSAKVKSDEASLQKSNFLKTVSHEIRTPLNAIIGVTEIELLNEEHPPGLQESFLWIYNSGYSLLSIINDLLDLSKIEAGKMEIVPARYEIASLVSDVVQFNILRQGGKPLEFELTIDENTPSVLLGDEIRIKQALNNVLSNAFKYTDSGKISFGITYELAEDDSLVLVFTISDTGHGMTAGQVNKLFEEYSRFLTQAERGAVGTGLGMSITKKILDLMDGAIYVKSEPGVGSVFTIKIPQQYVKGSTLGSETAGKLRQFRTELKSSILNEKFIREYMPYGSVLVVDDVESNLFVAKGLLLPYGLSVDTAINGPEAIARVKSGMVYDMILMDHMMPDMDGIETARRIRGLGYKNPIVALTANAMQGQAEMFLANGFEGFISKPIDIRQLNLTLNRLIRDRHSKSVVESARKQKSDSAKLPPVPYTAELAQMFARDAELAADTLQAVLGRLYAPLDGDLTLYTVNIHALKSILANAGEAELSDAALRLEKASLAGELNVIAEETESFLAGLQAVIKKLRCKEEYGEFELSDDDKQFLSEQWAILRSACLTYDKRLAKETLRGMRGRKLPRKVMDTLDAVSEHLLHSDFEEAAAIAEREAGGDAGK